MHAAETPNLDPALKPTNTPPTTDANGDPIAVPDRIMIALFLIVGCFLGMIILADFILGFFR
jgi:hypothetical protein